MATDAALREVYRGFSVAELAKRPNDLFVYERSISMNPGEGPYSVQRLRLTKKDIWTLPDGSSCLTIVGQYEEFFVIGRIMRNNRSKTEQFLPNQSPNGKITTTERREGMARLICYNLNVEPCTQICERLRQVPSEQRLLLAYAALHYFSPGLDYAVRQMQATHYDVEIKYLIAAAPWHDTWYVGSSMACMNQEEMVLIRSPHASFETPPLITFSFEELAKVAFPDPARTERGEKA